MCFDETHYPDYRPGYQNYDRMWELLWYESSKIIDFAFRKNLSFHNFDVNIFNDWDGFDFDAAQQFNGINTDKHKDVYIASATIPEK